MTLEELKQQNAEAEAKAQVAQPEAEAEAEVQDNPEAEELDASAGDETEDKGESQDVPLWMQSEDQTSQDDQMPVKSHIAMKHKLKGRLQDANDEIATLRKELEQIKSGKVQQPAEKQTSQQLKRPKLEDFDYDQEKYDAAVDDYYEKRFDSNFESHQQQQQQKQAQERMNQAVDGHYERAAKLVNDGMLTADEYQSSDSFVRRQLDGMFPGNGDVLADQLVATLGDGSEKVVVALSRNNRYMDELQKAFRDDPSGSKALVYLGSLKAQFNGTNPRVSQAPRPGKRVKGDESVADEGSKMKKAYAAAHKSGDRQKAFDIKRKAKLSGVDVKQW